MLKFYSRTANIGLLEAFLAKKEGVSSKIFLQVKPPDSLIFRFIPLWYFKCQETYLLQCQRPYWQFVRPKYKMQIKKLLVLWPDPMFLLKNV